MKITKKQLYKILATHTRGKMDAISWGKTLNIFYKVMMKLLEENEFVYTPIGTFEVRKCRRRVTGFKDGEATYEDRCEIKYVASKKLKETVNGRNK
jgi:nucleoid DNA-binding protein